jgi:hypothetical protein
MIYGTRSSRTMLGGPATLTNPAVAARVRQLAAQAGHHPAAQPQIDTSTCQNMNTECCRIICRQRGR